MEDSDTISDLDLDNPPKLTFDEIKTMAMKDIKQLKKRNDLLKAFYYYCKDSKIKWTWLTFIYS